MAVPTAPVALRRAGYRVAYMGLRVYWFLLRPHTRAVKCVVREGDAVLFVRHAYGDRRCWELPGGGIKRGEDPRAGAAREAREELGLDLADWRPLGAVEARGRGKRTTMMCFEARPPGREFKLDAGEIEEAQWFDLAAPPARLGIDARVVLPALLGCDVRPRTG
jgi:8-oxo-dGTP pyrophosphatase MutT (NUDIX family)